MVLTVLLLFLGFALLIKGADFLVKGASALARKFNVSELVIGLTIVALGTSAPELVVSVVSSTKGLNEVVYGNVIGSNIFNLFLILGVSAVIYPIVVQRSTIKVEIPYSLLAIVLVFILVNDELLWGIENYFSRIDAFILLIFFSIFMFYVFKNMKRDPEAAAVVEKQNYSGWIMTFMILGGLLGLVFGGQLVVDNAVIIARSFNLSDKMIGLTIIAAGTSLPELATSAVAAFRKNSDISIGNVVGSNIFNLLFVLGISGVISPMDYNPSLNVDVYVVMAGTVLLFILFLGKTSKLTRWEAVILLVGYISYVAYLIWRE